MCIPIPSLRKTRSLLVTESFLSFPEGSRIGSLTEWSGSFFVCAILVCRFCLPACPPPTVACPCLRPGSPTPNLSASDQWHSEPSNRISWLSASNSQHHPFLRVTTPFPVRNLTPAFSGPTHDYHRYRHVQRLRGWILGYRNGRQSTVPPSRWNSCLTSAVGLSGRSKRGAGPRHFASHVGATREGSIHQENQQR